MNSHMDAGSHRLEWASAHLPSGVYVCRMESNSFSKTIKMVQQNRRKGIAHLKVFNNFFTHILLFGQNHFDILHLVFAGLHSTKINAGRNGPARAVGARPAR